VRAGGATWADADNAKARRTAVDGTSDEKRGIAILLIGEVDS
jgi:hypothetical protein